MDIGDLNFHSRINKFCWIRSPEDLLYPESSAEPVIFRRSTGLTNEALTALHNFLANIKCRTVAMFELMSGEVANKFPPDYTAFVHRNSFFLLQFEMKLRG